MKPELSLKLSRLLAAGAIGLLCTVALAMGLNLTSRQLPVAVAAGTLITVDTFDDEYNTGPSTCSLREAIQSINVITSFGGCTNPGLAADTIQLITGTYNLTRGPASSYNNISGSLYINANMTILGAGAGQTIINNTVANDRVFDIHVYGSGAYVKLQGLTAQGGNASGDGGGIYVDVNDFSDPDTVHFVLDDVVVKDNQSNSSGGGISLFLANKATFTDVTLENNQAFFNGGGLYVEYGANVNLERVTVYSNTANFGGGIFYQSVYVDSRLAITNTTIYSNAAQTIGGGLYINYYYASYAMVNNATIASNRAITGWNIYNNQSAITLTNSIVADATGANASKNCAGNPTASIGSGGHNLDSGNSCGLSGTDDKVNTNPSLEGTLADNGGKTWTLALLGGSPAINGGDDSACPATDQRGVPRMPPCDIGAYEYVVWIHLPLVLRNR